MSEIRRCEWCGARLGPRDRVCFSCQRPVPVAAAAATAPAEVGADVTRSPVVPLSAAPAPPDLTQPPVPPPLLVFPAQPPASAPLDAASARPAAPAWEAAPRWNAAPAQAAPQPPPPPPPPPSVSAGPLRLELAWGRDRRVLTVPSGGATIGATADADVVVPAPFLAPVHA